MYVHVTSLMKTAGLVFFRLKDYLTFTVLFHLSFFEFELLFIHQQSTMM